MTRTGSPGSRRGRIAVATAAGVAGSVQLVNYRSELLAGILELAQGEGWPSLATDPARADRALRAPGVTTIVATMSPGDEVVGFAQVQSDGEIQAHLSMLVVAPRWRRRGLGKDLVNEGFRRAGGSRMDLVTDTAGRFYRALPHRRLDGYRLYLKATES